MPKNIVFCADGTWNSPNQDDNHDQLPDPSNVYKFFLSLEGELASDSLKAADEQEKQCTIDGKVVQVSKYIHGVGDSRNPLVKFMGGTFGSGIITRIVRGYTFISRNYQPGDSIFIVGFSRGAYTARALAGFIAAQGLLKGQPDDKDQAYRRGAEAWYRYRSAYHKSHNKPKLLASLAEIAADLPAFLSSHTLKEADFAAVTEIYSVAVWDTVGAMGIPDFDGDERLDTFRFADTALSKKVKWGLHAVSLDERRSDFTPTLWDDRPGVKQILFPGAHADVGGGYPQTNNESDLSDGSLLWMSDELQALGVRLSDKTEYNLIIQAKGTAHQPWRNPIWKVMDKRDFAPAVVGHCSIGERARNCLVRPDPKAQPDNYNPPNRPTKICCGPNSMTVKGFSGTSLCVRCRYGS